MEKSEAKEKFMGLMLYVACFGDFETLSKSPEVNLGVVFALVVENSSKVVIIISFFHLHDVAFLRNLTFTKCEICFCGVSSINHCITLNAHFHICLEG
jgi:mRNA deadenylase 3'-5' endonuclease subunit Ccr4